MSTTMEQTIADTLSQCQRNASAHTKGVRDLWKAYSKNPTKFRQQLIPYFNLILTVGKREPAVERLVRFIAKFVCHFYDLEDEADKRKSKQLAEFVLRYLLEHDEAKNKHIRFRVCNTVAVILAEINNRDQHLIDKSTESQDLSSIWCLQSELVEKMTTRLKDKVSNVRTEACKALITVFKRTNDEGVLESLTDALESDPAREVRKAILSAIPVNKDTIGFIVHRARDIEEDIRILAYKIVAKNLVLDQLDITQRVALISDGLRDKSDAVKEACITMVKAWVESSGGFENFLKYFAIEATEELMDEILKKVFVDMPVEHSKLKLAPTEIEVSNEKALLLRVFCEFVQEKAERENRLWHASNVLDEIMPELTHTCLLITAADEKGRDFVVRQFLRLCKLADFSDEAGRRALSSLLCQNIIPNTKSPDVRREAMIVLRKMNTDQRDYIQLVVEFLATIFDSESSMNDDEQTMAMWDTCLAITEQLLLNTTYRSRSPAIMGVAAQIITPASRHTDPKVRSMGIRCLGLLCLHDLNLAKSFIPFFLTIINNDTDAIRIVALKIVFDLLLIFGPKALGDNKANQENAVNDNPADGQADDGQPILETLMDYLNEENSDLRTAAGEGFSKLLFNDIISDPQILSRLCLELFNPLTERYARLHRCLKVFFQHYASSSPDHMMVLEQATILSLRQILKASDRSILGRFDCKKVGTFLFELTDPTRHPNLEGDTSEISRIHNRLAEAFLQDISTNPLGRHAKVLPELIQLLNLDASDKSGIMKLRVLVEKSLKFVKDSASIKTLKNIRQKLEKMNPEELQEEHWQEIEEYESQRDMILSQEYEQEDKNDVVVQSPPRAKAKQMEDKQKAVSNKFERTDEMEVKIEDVKTEDVKTEARTTTQDKKRGRSKRRSSSDLDKEYFAEKNAEFAEVEEFHILSQLPTDDVDHIEVEIDERQIPSHLENRVKKLFGEKVSDNDVDVEVDVELPSPPSNKTARRISFSPAPETKALQKKLEEKMRRKMEIQAKIDKLEQITALVDNPDAQAILESLKRDIHKLDDDTEELQANTTDKAKSRVKERHKPKRTNSTAALFLAGATTTPNKTANQKTEAAEPKRGRRSSLRSKSKGESDEQSDDIMEVEPTGFEFDLQTPKVSSAKKKKESKEAEVIEVSESDSEEEEPPKRITRQSARAETPKKSNSEEKKETTKRTRSTRSSDVAESATETPSQQTKRNSVPGTAVKRTAAKVPKEEQAEPNEEDTSSRRSLRTRAQSSPTHKAATEAANSKKRKRRASEQDVTDLPTTPTKRTRRSSVGDAPVLVRSGRKNQSLLRPYSTSKPQSVENESDEESSSSSDHKQETTQHTQGSAEQSQRPERSIRKPVVAFTGFSDTNPKYNLKYKAALMQDAAKLGLTVVAGDKHETSITHVVAPPSARTFKTLVAVLGGRWLVTPRWIEESKKEGMVLPEKDFGIRRLHNPPLANKKVFITESFKEHKHYNAGHMKMFIETLGRGKIVTNAFEADIVLIGANEEFEETGTQKVFRWNQFFEYIQPPFPAT